MKALKEFDYNLWTTEENGVKKYFVGVKATGEVTEVDAEVMKVLLVCGCCGGAYKRTCKNETDKKVYYWRCINRIDHGTTACRDSFGIEEKKLHSAILRCLSKMMSDREEVVRLIQSNLQYGISGNAATLDVYNLENQIAQLNEDMTIFMDRAASTGGDVDKYEAELKKMFEQLTALRNLLETAKSQAAQSETVNNEVARLTALLMEADLNFSEFDDVTIRRIVECIATFGVITPVIARKTADERYELISGHRRKRACELLHIDTLPIIVRDLSREEGIILMVDSNLQREHILPSEKAFAYKMKMEALKCQGKRNDLTLSPLATKFDAAKEIADSSGEGRDQVFRYIRLTELIPQLLQMVDEGKIAFRPAVELSYLEKEEQEDLLETIESEDCTPSLAQAIRMKGLSRDNQLDMDKIFEIMTEEKANQKEKLRIPMERVESFFKRGTPPSVMIETVIKALELYRRALNQQKRAEQGKLTELDDSLLKDVCAKILYNMEGTVTIEFKNSVQITGNKEDKKDERSYA